MAARRRPSASEPPEAVEPEGLVETPPLPPEDESEEELAQSSPDHAPPLPPEDESEEEDSDEGAATDETVTEFSEPAPLYFVAPKHSINTRSRDIQKAGSRIYPADFFDGQKRIDQLLAANFLVKR